MAEMLLKFKSNLPKRFTRMNNIQTSLNIINLSIFVFSQDGRASTTSLRLGYTAFKAL